MYNLGLFLKKNDFIKPIDLIITLYFSILSIILLFFHNGVKYYYLYILFFILFIFFLFQFLKFASKNNNNKIINFLRYLYPILMYVFLYKAIDPFMLSVHSDWMDKYINHIEFFVFGNEPTILLQKIVTPVLTEILKFAYFSYYFIVFVPALYFYFAKKEKIFDEYVESVSIAFYICYIGFVLFPVQGPRYEFSGFYTVNLDGYFFTRLQDFIMAKGSTHGGCMPSSHVAASCMAWRVINRHFKKMSYFLLPLVILLCFSTVYHRYHYFSDVVAGLIVVWVASYLRDYFKEIYNKYKFL
jgi:membrane-associated phospholipid phosphatase